MAWVYLLFAIILEVAGTIFLKVSHGMTRAVPTMLMVVFYILSVVGMALALEKMDVGVAYAVWSALGIALVATIGILWFDEPASMMKLASLALIIVGVIFLNLASAHAR
jgi:small multidrug resistance pump